jgi:hypothetical protein
MLGFSLGVLTCALAVAAWHLFGKQVGMIEASLQKDAAAKSAAIAAKITQDITKAP